MPRRKKSEAEKEQQNKPVERSPQEIAAIIDQRYPLHEYQLLLEKAVFEDKKKRIFAQCGRNFGKSIWIGRTTAKWACTHPNSHCYIITPEKVQGKEIYWDSGMLLAMIPEDMIAINFLGKDEVTKNELRIRLKNGSFIKILGADEPKTLRGIKPHLCSFDEYRDFKEEVYWSMEANLLGKGATLLIGSTPPDIVGPYSETRDYYIQQVKQKNLNYFYLELPSSCNPHLNKDDLEEIRLKLIVHGKVRVWEREYLAKFIPGGASSVFPMFAERKEAIVKPAFIIKEIVRSTFNDLDFYCAYDPATSSVFGVLFVAINKYTSQFIVLNEIYERDRMRTSSVDMWKRSAKIKMRYNKKLHKWDNTYDEHESWFDRDIEKAEILEDGETLDPTNKASRNKEEDLSLFKDMMLVDNCLLISDECVNLIEEIESCTTDKNDKIIKKKDHLLDDCRYIIAKADFSLNESPDYVGYIKGVEKRGTKLPSSYDEFLDNQKKQQDWTHGIDESEVFSNDEVVFLDDISYGNSF